MQVHGCRSRFAFRKSQLLMINSDGWLRTTRFARREFAVSGGIKLNSNYSTYGVRTKIEIYSHRLGFRNFEIF